MVRLEQGHKVEINFVIKRFLQLSLFEQQQVYDGLCGVHSQGGYVRAGIVLAALLGHGGDELTTFINESFGSPGLLTDYLPGLDDAVGATVIAQYFKDNIRQVGEGFEVTEAAM